MVEVPIRLADPAVAAVVRPGDVVDVIAADRGVTARVVAARVTVTQLPDAGGDGLWGPRDGLVMVASDEDDALALAGAAARGPVTIVIHP
jgi:pilus assembly protein CpaB